MIPEMRPRTMFELLEQGELWRMKDGQWKPVADMTQEHRLNVAKFLLKHACTIKVRYELARIWSAPGQGYDDDPDIDFSDMENPVVWIAARPLYLALMRDLPEGANAMAALRRRASHHHTCEHSKRFEQRTHGAPCTCKGQRGANDVASA